MNGGKHCYPGSEVLINKYNIYDKQLLEKLEIQKVTVKLLGLDIKGADSHVPEKRTEEYYKKRPCKEMVEIAARITAEYFLEI